MPSQYLHSGEPLPLEPSLTGEKEEDLVELRNFHSKLMDYIRRLTAKLSSDVFAPPTANAVETFAAKLRNDFNLPSGDGTYDTVVWDDVLRQDAPYGYDNATGIVTFLQDGFYLYLVDVMIQGTINYQTRLIDNTGTTLPYGDGHVNMSVGVETLLSQTIPVHLHKDQTIEFQCESSNSVEADNSRMTILRLGDFAGTGPDSPDPCDFDIWQFCP